MSSIWFDAALDRSRPDACWELYHENSKRGRRMGGHRPPPAAMPAASPYDGLPVFPLAAPGPLPLRLDQASIDAAVAAGTVTMKALSDLLAASCRPMSEDDPVEAFLQVAAVETLPQGLYRYDARGHALQLIRRGVIERLARALADPATVAGRAVIVFLVGSLESAAALSGERGYRGALIATGRHLLALRLAAGAAGLPVREDLDTYDREVDALLSLDGIAKSVLAVVAIGSAGSG
jgi:SagB-type dehydrogenase family enzyme